MGTAPEVRTLLRAVGAPCLHRKVELERVQSPWGIPADSRSARWRPLLARVAAERTGLD